MARKVKSDDRRNVGKKPTPEVRTKDRMVHRVRVKVKG